MKGHPTYVLDKSSVACFPFLHHPKSKQQNYTFTLYSIRSSLDPNQIVIINIWIIIINCVWLIDSVCVFENVVLEQGKGDNFINDKAVGGGVSGLSIIIVMYVFTQIN